MLPSTSLREVLACPPFLPWNLPLFIVESTISSPCSRFDSPVSRQDAALAHLDSLSLMIWLSGQTALFLLLLARTAPAFLPTALSVVLRPLFPLRQTQFVQVSPLKPAPSCTLFAGLGSSNKSTISLLLSSYLILVLSSPLCLLLHFFSYLKLCARSCRNCLLSSFVLSGYNGSPDTRFSRETTRLMSWTDGERYLGPPQPRVVSLFSYLYYPLLSFLRLEAYCLIEVF